MMQSGPAGWGGGDGELDRFEEPVSRPVNRIGDVFDRGGGNENWERLRVTPPWVPFTKRKRNVFWRTDEEDTCGIWMGLGCLSPPGANAHRADGILTPKEISPRMFEGKPDLFFPLHSLYVWKSAHPSTLSKQACQMPS